MKVTLSTIPERLLDRKSNSVDLVISAESGRHETVWLEADIRLEGNLSLKDTSHVPIGRVRVGICDGWNAISKPVKVYADNRTMPGLYKCSVSVYAYDHKGDQVGRNDTYTLINCTSAPKPPSNSK